MELRRHRSRSGWGIGSRGGCCWAGEGAGSGCGRDSISFDLMRQSNERPFDSCKIFRSRYSRSPTASLSKSFRICNGSRRINIIRSDARRCVASSHTFSNLFSPLGDSCARRIRCQSGAAKRGYCARELRRWILAMKGDFKNERSFAQRKCWARPFGPGCWGFARSPASGSPPTRACIPRAKAKTYLERALRVKAKKVCVASRLRVIAKSSFRFVRFSPFCRVFGVNRYARGFPLKVASDFSQTLPLAYRPPPNPAREGEARSRQTGEGNEITRSLHANPIPARPSFRFRNPSGCRRTARRFAPL